MLRTESETGWWLTTHSDHAKLAGEIASAWGNEKFRRPEPRDRVLLGVNSNNDGWAEHDANLLITRDGKPAAFSLEVVGQGAAFEEIDLQDYLKVRDHAARSVGEKDPYAALLIAMHTYSQLTEHTDRSRIPSEGRVLLDDFLDQQRVYQEELRAAITAQDSVTPEHKEEKVIQDHFKLLQACDKLALMACVAFASPANLLHPLPLNDGEAAIVRVLPVRPREFRLHPWPFAEEELTLTFPARHVKGKLFVSSSELQSALNAAQPQKLAVTLLQ